MWGWVALAAFCVATWTLTSGEVYSHDVERHALAQRALETVDRVMYTLGMCTLFLKRTSLRVGNVVNYMTASLHKYMMMMRLVLHAQANFTTNIVRKPAKPLRPPPSFD